MAAAEEGVVLGWVSLKPAAAGPGKAGGPGSSSNLLLIGVGRNRNPLHR